MTQAVHLRPMGLLEIVDQTFRLYRSNFWLFLGTAAVVLIPVSVLTAVPVLQVLALVLSPAANLLVSAALTKGISDTYLGDRTTIGTCYGYIARRIFALVGTIIVMYLFVAAGILVFLVGMIIFGFWVLFVTQVFVIEDKRYFSAIRRSRFLVGKGVWAEVLVLLMIVGFLVLMIQGAIGLVLGAPFFFVTQEPEAEVAFFHFVLNGIVQSLVTPIGAVALVLLYYDSRIRKEGFDLEILAREIGKELPPPAEPAGPTSPGEQSPPGAGPDQGST